MYSDKSDLLNAGQVSLFRHLRIKACLATPRSLSQPCHVFHRFLTPKHPPYTLCSLTAIIPEQPAITWTENFREQPQKPRKKSVNSSKTLQNSRKHPETARKHLETTENTRKRSENPEKCQKKTLCMGPTRRSIFTSSVL